MRPYSITYTPADDSATGFRSNATGTDFALTATSAADNLAHLVIFDPDGTPDLHTITVDLVGTDADGKAQTETITLSADGSATTSTKYYLTFTSATPSATIGAETVDIGWTDDIVSPTYPLDYASTAQADIAVAVTGTINYTVQETFANVLAGVAAAWSSISALTSKTALTASQADAGATAFRVLVNSLTSGATFTIYTVQPVRR